MEQDFAKRRMRTPLAEPSAVPQPSSLGLLLTGLITGIAIGLFISLLVYLSGALPPAPGQAALSDERQIETAAITTADGQLTVEQQREAQRLQLEFYQELPNYEVVVDVTPVRGAVPRTPVAATPAQNQSSPATTVVTAEPDASASGSPETSSSETSTPGTNPVTTATVPAQAQALASDSLPPASSTPPAQEELDPVSAALLEISNRTATTPAASPVPPASNGSNFMLQAGAFQQQATAQAQLNRLLGLGLNARIRQENLPGRTLFLVQAGPYASRDDMMQAERVLRSNSIDSMRITLSQP